MSSHHFVKEQQEPALLVLNIDNVRFQQIAELLEWVPTIIVTQENIHKVMSWGIKVDYIIADPTFQKENGALLQEQFPVKFIEKGRNSFLQTGLENLISTGHHAANIVQWDHEKTAILEPYLDQLDLVFYDGPIRYFPAKDGRISKWFRKGALQLHAKEGQFIEIKSNESNKLISIKHATFLEVEEGFTDLKSDKIFWVGILEEEQ